MIQAASPSQKGTATRWRPVSPDVRRIPDRQIYGSLGSLMMKLWGNYPLVMTNIAMENHHAINGKINIFYGKINYKCHFQ
jgi:hypothetical protein